MSAQTSYDDVRDELKEGLEDCLKKAKILFVETDMWGADQYPKDYGEKVYRAVKKALNEV